MGEAVKLRDKEGEEDKANAKGDDGDGLVMTSLSGMACRGERRAEDVVGLRYEGRAGKAMLGLLMVVVAALFRGDDVGRVGKGDLERGPPGEERGEDNRVNASRIPLAEGVRVRLGMDLSKKGLGTTPDITREGGGPLCCTWLSRRMADGVGAASPTPSDPSGSGWFMRACACKGREE